METRCGFVSLVGRPNVGKSTLINRILEEPLAIISPKPQTTWSVVRGILTASPGQIVFIDTPGLHEPRDALGDQMVSAARRSLAQADLIYWMVDCREKPQPSVELIEKLLPPEIPAYLLLNKVDLLSKPLLLPLIDCFGHLGRFEEIIPLSALTGENVEKLLRLTWKHLPAGPLLFPPDQLSDQPERELVKEFIREQVFRYTHQEIPYASAVKIEEMKEREARKKIFLSATIYVEKESQKGMLVGKGGGMIKKIGSAARLRIEGLLGKPVFLQLRVKVRKKWKKDKISLREFGLEA